MKIFKKLICVLLITALALPVLPMNALAKGKYSFIDYNRIKRGTGGAMVVLQMGDVSIPGKLTNRNELTDEQIDELIEAFVRSRGAKLDDIKFLQDAVDLAKRLENMTKEEAQALTEALISLLGLGGGSVLTIILSILAGDYGGAAGTIGDAGVEKIAEEMAGKIGSKAWGSINTVSGAIKAVNELSKSANRRQAQLAARYAAAEAKSVLDAFYRELGKFIDEKTGAGKWRIEFANARGDRPNFTFLGQRGCKQWWILDMYLGKESEMTLDNFTPGRGESAEGSYSGDFMLTVEHDMSDFAGDAAKYVKSALMPLLDSSFPEGSWNSVETYTITSGSATVTRVITGTAKVTITKEKGKIGYKYTISMDGDGKPEVDCSGMQVEYIADGTMGGALYAREEVLDVYSKDESILLNFLGGTNTFTAPNGYSGSVESPPGGEWPIGWDDQIWKPWESEKTLR